MLERRQQSRTKIVLNARITFLGRPASIECRLHDVSDAGAKIILLDNYILPGEFDLNIADKYPASYSKVIWRSHDVIGLQFAATGSNVIHLGRRRQLRAHARSGR